MFALWGHVFAFFGGGFALADSAGCDKNVPGVGSRVSHGAIEALDPIRSRLCWRCVPLAVTFCRLAGRCVHDPLPIVFSPSFAARCFAVRRFPAPSSLSSCRRYRSRCSRAGRSTSVSFVVLPVDRVVFPCISPSSPGSVSRPELGSSRPRSPAPLGLK